MTLETKQLGALGEKIAEEYLKKQGYKILDKNFRYRRYGEIDIIAKKGEDIVFIEVKTRLRSASFGGQAREDVPYNPEDNITYFKQKQLIKLAKLYLAKNHSLNDLPWQIDVIAVEINPNTNETHLRHIEQAICDLI